MPDSAPIRGRWKLYGVRDHGLTYYQGLTTPPNDVWVVPVPDEAAIERGANALRRVPRRAVSDEADEGQLREWAEAVLRAALEPGDT